MTVVRRAARLQRMEGLTGTEVSRPAVRGKSVSSPENCYRQCMVESTQRLAAC